LTGIHQRTAPTKINRTDWNDLVTFLGGTSSDPQIDATKILLAQGGSLLSTWRYASDLTRIDAAKVAGNIAAAQMQTNVLAAIIAAGGIVDADVAAGAAIAKSKISTSGTWPLADLPSPHHTKLFSAYQSVAQTLTKNTWNQLTFDVEEFDLDSVFASNHYSPGAVGYYLIGGACYLNLAEDGKFLTLSLAKNLAAFKDLSNPATGAASSYPQASGSVLIYLSNANDYVDLWAYHNNSVDKTTVAGQRYVYFWGFKI